MISNQSSFRVLVPEGVDSMAHVSELVNNFRPAIRRKAELLMDIFISSKRASGDYDATTAYDYWVDRRMAVNMQGFTDLEVDTAFTLHFAPVMSTFNGGPRMLIGIAYCVHAGWLKEWLKQPTVEEYGYWGRERPSRTKEAEWVERGRHWDSTVNPHGAIGTQCYTIELLGPYEPFPKGMRERDMPANIAV